MEKFEHMSRMFNNRTVNKKYENFVVNTIYTKIGNYELIPVTQQCVRNINGKKKNADGSEKHKYYFLDLYFPQLNYGIEVDEGQHENFEHKMSDTERAENIKAAIDCEEGRITIFENDGNTFRSFEDITSQIDREVEKIQKMIDDKENDGKKIKWLTNEEKRAEVFERGNFDVNEDKDVVYAGINQIYNLLGYPNKTRKAFLKLNDAYSLCVPTLTIVEDGKTNKDPKWQNSLNEDRTEIIERDSKNDKELRAGVGEECYAHLSDKKQYDYTSKRVVFMKMKDIFGQKVVKFIGVFQFTKAELQDDGSCIRHYERVGTRVNISDLKC